MAVVITETDGEYRVSAPFSLRATLKAITGARWNPSLRAWVYPASPDMKATLQRALGPQACFVEAPEGPEPTDFSDIDFDQTEQVLRREITLLKQQLDRQRMTITSLETELAASQRKLAELRPPDLELTAEEKQLVLDRRKAELEKKRAATRISW